MPAQLTTEALAIVLVLLALAPAITSANEAPSTVPDPLSLEQALRFAATHPRVIAAEQDAGAEAAEPETPESGAGASASASVSPPGLPRAQPLYLGCHTVAFSGARSNDAERDVAWSALLSSADAQRLEIMQRFYDVLLADLSFARDNEAMAVAFIQFDRAEAREELGQFSPLRTAELQADYQLIRRQRAASEAAQRVTRALLATALGHPTSLPRQLLTPAPEAPEDALPELDAVVAAALEQNAAVEALMRGRSQAEQALVRMAVRERALELLTRLELLEVIAEQARSESDWRDLKLDESRTLYELEAKADLGFSMSQQTKARRDEQEIAFCRALTRAELDALQGLEP
ncbi:TolC family protein [Halochromatium sp.]